MLQKTPPEARSWALPSHLTTTGRMFSGAQALWLAAGMKPEALGMPIVGIVNSATDFVPGHVHLFSIGRRIKRRIERYGWHAAEFNTIAIDDGIAMGHEGMHYSLPSRELIADSIESMVKAHPVDGLIFICSCDKIIPGMFMAAMRLNLPCIFVTGGPMEAGEGGIDLIDVMAAGPDPKVSDADLYRLVKFGCPTCGSCAGSFTANTLACLLEPFGMALPGNATVLATHKDRIRLFEKSADTLIEMMTRIYRDKDLAVLPRSIVTKTAFTNAMVADVAMGGSTNTTIHLPAIAHEAGIELTLRDFDPISRKTPTLVKISPNSKYHMEDFNRAGGMMALLGELKRADLIDCSAAHVATYAPGNGSLRNIGDVIKAYDITTSRRSNIIYLGAPGRVRTTKMGAQNKRYAQLDLDRDAGCVRRTVFAYSKEGGLAVLVGNLAEDGCVIKTAGVDPSMLKFKGPAIVFHSQKEAVDGILSGRVKRGHVVVIAWEGPAGAPGCPEMLYPTTFLKSMGLDLYVTLITDARFSGGSRGGCIGHVSPEAAAGGLIGLLRDGDIIEYDIPNRTIHAHLSKDEIAARRTTWTGKPNRPPREVSDYLKAYARLVSSAADGAVRRVD